MKYRFGSQEFDFASRTYIMGVVNVTPDSFSDGGRYLDPEAAIEHGLKLIEDGADILDVGGESTRPAAEVVTMEEELRRVIPVISGLAKKTSTPISVDTYKSAVAARALGTGATIVNDISGLHFDEQMPDVIAQASASVILMHIQGTPKTMQQSPVYHDVVSDICDYLQEGISRAQKWGIRQVVIDPGIGFGKTLDHNLEIFGRLREFERLGYPILIGPSRKSFIGKILNQPNAAERLEGTAAAVAVSILNGANIVRVHDVKELKRVAMVVDEVKRVKSIRH